MPQSVTPQAIREFLIDTLTLLRTPSRELESWESLLGNAEVWRHAVSYCANRPHDLRAIQAGFNKSGDSVIRMIDAMKDRAPGPREPEQHIVPNTFAMAWVWRTSEGPKFVVLERAPKVVPEGAETPSQFWYWPDQWRQIRKLQVNEDRGIWHLEIGGEAVAWSVPKRKTQQESMSFDHKVSTPCAEADCEAESAAECGHKTFAEKIGGDLPEPGPGRVKCGPCTKKTFGSTEVYHVPPACDDPSVKPCDSCGNVKCRENGVMVCRSPGCSKNPSTPLEHPDGSPGHDYATRELQLRAGAYREAAERSRRVREDLNLGPNPKLDELVCGVCEGIDPESSDAPNSGHHWECPIGDKKLSEGYADVDRSNGKADAGVPLDPDAPDDLRANPDWSPAGKPEVTGTDSEAATPGPRQEDSAPSATGEGSEASGDRPDHTHAAPTSSTATEGSTDSGEAVEDEVDAASRELREEGYWDGTGIMPAAKCGQCGHDGQDHDHRTKKCARCGECPGFTNPELDQAKRNLEETITKQRGGKDHAEIMGRCACGCAFVKHAGPPDYPCTSLCPCVKYRALGSEQPVEIESIEDRAAYEERIRREYVLSLDLDKVTRQRVAKEYAQCQLCKKMIKGSVKDGKKIKTPGEDWVGPKPKKKGKTISMRHRSHLSCADEALLQIHQHEKA